VCVCVCVCVTYVAQGGERVRVLGKLDKAVAFGPWHARSVRTVRAAHDLGLAHQHTAREKEGERGQQAHLGTHKATHTHKDTDKDTDKGHVCRSACTCTHTRTDAVGSVYTWRMATEERAPSMAASSLPGARSRVCAASRNIRFSLSRIAHPHCVCQYHHISCPA
jgi:hypothetical protein